MTTPTVPSFNDIDGDTFTKMWDTIKDKKTDFTADEVNKFQKVIIVIIIILFIIIIILLSLLSLLSLSLRHLMILNFVNCLHRIWKKFKTQAIEKRLSNILVN